MRRYALWLGLVMASPACGAMDQERVVVFHAGSLAPLMDEMSARFEEHHPGVRIQREASGSLDALRKITELGRTCDIVATADARLIREFLPAERFRGPVISFLGNEMVLATGRAELLDTPVDQERWQQDWLEELFRGGYSYGISDPDRDPAGYYAHLVWKLTEIHYDRPGAYQRFVNRFQQSWMRPRSSELIALLETGHLDFAFVYRSTALQNSLRFVRLPPQVSLADEGYAEHYRRAFVQVQGARRGTRMEIVGAPIRYGAALISDSAAAGRFLKFLLQNEAQPVYRELGYASVTPQEISALRKP